MKEESSKKKAIYFKGCVYRRGDKEQEKLDLKKLAETFKELDIPIADETLEIWARIASAKMK